MPLLVQIPLFLIYTTNALPSTAPGRASGIHPTQLPHLSADTTRKARSAIPHGEGNTEAPYPAHTAGVPRGFLTSFGFGGSQPTKAPWATPFEVHPREHLCTNVRLQRYLPQEATLFVEEGTLIANVLTIVVQERSQPAQPTTVVA